MKLIEKIGNTKQHLLIQGDNINALAQIHSKCVGKVDLIYIDPPYNTGKKMGKYDDNFSSHTKWIEFIRPRLEIGYDFLSDTGLMFISIGENEEAHLKLLCNDIFGEENKVSSIIWQSKYTVANDKVGISTQTEYILVYAKDIKNIIINNDPLREEYVKSTYKNPDNDPRGLWRGGVQLYKKKNKHSYTVVSPTGKKWTMPWNYSQEQWKNVLEKEDLIYWGKDGNCCPVKKVFLKDSKGINIKNLWLGEEVGYTADGGETLEKMFGDRNSFLYPKPVSLMKRILQIAAQPNSTVMDFFAGSGTFGHAVLEHNKEKNTDVKFILITNNDNKICGDITFPRLKKVIEGYSDIDGKQYEATGGNLHYYINE
jgi:adenine-specific DNA-methyltransferase